MRGSAVALASAAKIDCDFITDAEEDAHRHSEVPVAGSGMDRAASAAAPLTGALSSKELLLNTKPKAEHIRAAIEKLGFALNHRRALLLLAAAKITKSPRCNKKASVLELLKVATCIALGERCVCHCASWNARPKSSQAPMIDINHKWRRRVKAELKLVWLVIEDLYSDLMYPDGAPSHHGDPVDFETMTVSQLVSVTAPQLRVTMSSSLRSHDIVCCLSLATCLQLRKVALPLHISQLPMHALSNRLSFAVRPLGLKLSSLKVRRGAGRSRPQTLLSSFRPATMGAEEADENDDIVDSCQWPSDHDEAE